MTPAEARLIELLTQCGYPPLRVVVGTTTVQASFAAGAQAIEVDAQYRPGTTDASIASDLIIRAATRGVRVAR